MDRRAYKCIIIYLEPPKNDTICVISSISYSQSCLERIMIRRLLDFNSVTDMSLYHNLTAPQLQRSHALIHYLAWLIILPLTLALCSLVESFLWFQSLMCSQQSLISTNAFSFVQLSWRRTVISIIADLSRVIPTHRAVIRWWYLMPANYNPPILITDS